MFEKIFPNFLFSGGDNKETLDIFENDDREARRSIKSYLDEGCFYFTVPHEEVEDIVETLHHNNLEPVESKAETVLTYGMDGIGGCSQLLFYENLESLKRAVNIIWEQDKGKVFAVYNGDWILNKDEDIESFVDQ